MPINSVNLGKRIEQERLKLGLTREKFAEQIDISANYLGQLERGERHASLNTMSAIANSLHTSVDYLIMGIGNHSLSEINALLGKSSKEQLNLITEIVKTILKYTD